jgi:hypothetical protein
MGDYTARCSVSDGRSNARIADHGNGVAVYAPVGEEEPLAYPLATVLLRDIWWKRLILAAAKVALASVGLFY